MIFNFSRRKHEEPPSRCPPSHLLEAPDKSTGKESSLGEDSHRWDKAAEGLAEPRSGSSSKTHKSQLFLLLPSHGSCSGEMPCFHLHPKSRHPYIKGPPKHRSSPTPKEIFRQTLKCCNLPWNDARTSPLAGLTGAGSLLLLRKATSRPSESLGALKPSCKNKRRPSPGRAQIHLLPAAQTRASVQVLVRPGLEAWF